MKRKVQYLRRLGTKMLCFFIAAMCSSQILVSATNTSVLAGTQNSNKGVESTFNTFSNELDTYNIHLDTKEGELYSIAWKTSVLDVISEPDNQNVYATVSGKVTDTNGEPLPGVSVLVQGTTIGTVTDLDGNYSVDAPDGASLIFSFIGFESQTIVVGDQTVVNVTLDEDTAALDEVVVVGYGTLRKSDL